jgi:hypothetical protein
MNDGGVTGYILNQVDEYGNLSDFFSVEAGMCGASKLDIYYSSGNNIWNSYNSGGDGTVLGTCTSNQGMDGNECGVLFGSSVVRGELYCDTYLCR